MLAIVSIARSLYRGDAFCIYFVNINSAKRRVRDVIKMAYNQLNSDKCMLSTSHLT